MPLPTLITFPPTCMKALLSFLHLHNLHDRPFFMPMPHVPSPCDYCHSHPTLPHGHLTFQKFGLQKQRMGPHLRAHLIPWRKTRNLLVFGENLWARTKKKGHAWFEKGWGVWSLKRKKRNITREEGFRFFWFNKRGVKTKRGEHKKEKAGLFWFLQRKKTDPMHLSFGSSNSLPPRLHSHNCQDLRRFHLSPVWSSLLFH